ncbi:MAG TPA: hypothetical protein VN957_18560 [Chthoniobacterales bacterium]|jgi:hypothetical protein|nr:hypothetical protein [Chthoniobacterales bacterium]
MKEDHSSHEEFHNDVESMCQWLESMNIGIDKNRVAQYRKTSRIIAEHIRKGTVKELEKSLGFPKQTDTVHDVSELILIHQQLNDYDCPVFKTTLAQAVNGPTSLAEERPQSSDARNKVFELVIAAQLKAAGFRPKFVEPADAIVTIEGIKCYVECKRIQSENSLEENIQKASSQIKERLNQEASTKPRGLIAIDISKAINTDGTLYFTARSSDDLTKVIEFNLAQFLKRNRAKLTKDIHSRISAVLVYLRTPAVIEYQGGLLTNFRRLFAIASIWNDGTNKNIFQKLQKRLFEAEKNIFK